VKKKAKAEEAAVEGLADGSIEMVPLAAILPTFHNPRRIIANNPAVKELAASIERLTMLSPVIVRRLPAGPIAAANSADAPNSKQSWRVYAGTPGVQTAFLTGYMSNGKAETIAASLREDGVQFELLAGRRRFEAHKLLKREAIKARVLDLTDDQALEVTILENLQRVDLSPLEEARGVQSLLNTGKPAAAIAADLGKTETWVKRRASLTRLVPAVVKLAEESPETLNVVLTAAHLEIIARMPAEWQESFVANVYAYELRNVARFEASVMQSLMVLRSAPFDTGRADYGEGCKVSCVDCPKRTGRAPDLFHGSTDDAETIAKGERCLDPGCWGLKVAAFVEERKAKLQRQHESLLLVSQGHRSPGVLAAYDVNAVKKSTPGAKPALVVDGPAAGSMQWVRPLRDETVAPPAGPKGPTLELKRKAWVVKQVREALQTAPAPWTDLAHAAAALVIFGSLTNARYDVSGGDAFGDAEKLGGATDAELIEAIWNEVRGVLDCRLNMQKVGECGPYYVQAVRVALLIGAGDEKALLAEAEEAIPEKGKKGKGVKI